MDIVGLLPPSNGYSHLLTCANLLTRSPQATPLKDTSISSVIRALLHSWTSVYGITATITTDHGAKLTSTLFRDLMRSMECNHIIKKTFLPGSISLFERFPRQLKAAFRANGNLHWIKTLLLILLGIRATVKEDLQ